MVQCTLVGCIILWCKLILLSHRCTLLLVPI